MSKVSLAPIPYAARMNSTDAIESVFDAVSYQKGEFPKAIGLAPVLGDARQPKLDCPRVRLLLPAGASVLRMLRSFINRNNKQVPPPQHEVVPGATYEQARGQGWYAFWGRQACSMSVHTWLLASGRHACWFQESVNEVCLCEDMPPPAPGLP